MKVRGLGALLVGLLFAVPAQALTLIAENADVFTINSGDVFDNVIQFDASHITIEGGSIVDHYLMLDESTAEFHGGVVGGDLGVFGNAHATVVVQSGSLVVDGLPEVTPITLIPTNCATCTVGATLENGELWGSTPTSVLQNGRVDIVVAHVPEPTSAAMFGLGLLGLTLASRRPRA